MGKCMIEILEETMGDTDCSDGDDSYIEIELDSAPTCHNHDKNKSVLKESCLDNDDGACEDYQFRISISSTISISLPDAQKESTNVHSKVPNNVAAVPSLMSCSSDDDVLFNPTVLSQEILQPEMKTLSATRVIPCDNVDVLCSSRKNPSLTAPTKNGIMMKLLIKIKDMKIGALIASLMKPRQPCQVNNIHKSKKKSKTFFQCYQKRLVNSSDGRCSAKSREQRKRNKQWELEDYGICGSLRSSKKSNSGVMEMDLGALRGILDAMGMRIVQKSSISKRGSKSSSCNTTPIHEGSYSLCSTSSENSIQAAIAYCKSSLEQTCDFSFRSSISSSPSGSACSIS